MAIDHSLTYKKLSLRNFPHLLRKKSLEIAVKNLSKFPKNYADFGCSNGYLTNIFSGILRASSSYGFDCTDNILLARKDYPHINFDFIDLNLELNLQNSFQVITCFEVLEHVGNTSNALKILKSASSLNSVILISVPIEIGVIGLLKYIVKRFIFKYELPLKCNDKEYFFSLLFGKDIFQYREKLDSYGSHFGFDYRIIDLEVAAEFFDRDVYKWNSGTTRFYRIQAKP